MIRTAIPIPAAAALLCTLAACDPAAIYEKNTGIEESVWDRNNKVAFSADITDTTQVCNVYINVRHAAHYMYRNLFLFVATTLPDDHVLRDTVEIILADESGKWMGSGLGDIYDHRQLWKRAVRFPMPGVYRFEFEQAMTMEQVPFIMDVGIRIEKAE